MKKFDSAFNAEKYILPLDLDSADYPKREAISNLYHYLDDFLNTLMLELSRIEESRGKLRALENRRLVSFADRFYLVALWADYYFFLNTTDRAYQVSMELYEKIGENKKAEQIKRSNSYHITHKMRNQIEHLSEKVSRTGGIFYNQHRSMGQDYEIAIGDVSFKVCETSLEPLYQIYDDISNIIEQKYVVPNKETIDRLGL